MTAITVDVPKLLSFDRRVRGMHGEVTQLSDELRTLSDEKIQLRRNIKRIEEWPGYGKKTESPQLKSLKQELDATLKEFERVKALHHAAIERWTPVRRFADGLNEYAERHHGIRVRNGRVLRKGEIE